MKKNFLALFGHVAIDVTMNIDFFPTKGSVAVNSLRENYGGTAGNIALIGAKLGLPFHLFSAVGLKSHERYINFLKKIGADTSHLYVDPEDMGPIGYAASDGQDQIYYFFQGPMNKPLEGRITLDQEGYEWVHFGTGLPDDYLSMSRQFEGSKIVFDPGQEINYRYNKENLGKMLEISDLAILNEGESAKAEELLGISSGKLPAYCKNLIITRGARGSTYLHEGDSYDFPATLVEKPYDTIGAGDAFRAGFYFALWKDSSIEAAIKIGSLVSAEAIKRPFMDFDKTGEQILKQFSQ
jgi:6-phosphofructokinase 1/ribokinase